MFCLRSNDVVVFRVVVVDSPPLSDWDIAQMVREAEAFEAEDAARGSLRANFRPFTSGNDRGISTGASVEIRP